MNRKITIAGGGLAGLALAVALRQRNVPVSVLEAGSYPRHRVCGEFISGVTAETLAALGIAETLADARLHRSLRWLDRGKLVHRTQFSDPALGISRFQLDERLRIRAIALGASILTGVRARPEPRDGFVWAAGRRPRTGEWLGLKAHVRGLAVSSDLEMHSGTNGYAGLAGVEDGWTNVCGLFRLDRSLRAPAANLLPTYLDAGGNSALAAGIRAAEWRDGSVSAVAGFALGRQPEVSGLLALGDAESMIPPFTGNGMSMAFQAAELATQPLTEWSHGHRSWEETANIVRAALRRRFRRRLAIAQAIHPVLLSAAGRSLLHTLSDTRLLPFQPLLALIR